MVLYPNIHYEEGFIIIRKALNIRKDQTISTEFLIGLADCVLKNNIFEQNNYISKQLRGTAIRSKMAPPLAVIFIDSL